jgi:tetratricopeptide (TPR) repeat protein
MRIVPLLILALCSCRLAASEFQAGFDQLIEAKASDADIEGYLERAKAAQAGNPEWYVDTANHFARKASEGVVISRKPAGPGDLTLSDEKTGEAVGSIAAAEADPELMKPAIAALVEGTRRFPERLDLRFGLTRLYQEVDDFDRFLAALDEAAAYAAAHPTELRWHDGAPLDQPPERMVPEVIQSYAHDYFDTEDEAKGKRFGAITQIAVARYPKHPYAYTSLAVYWYSRGDSEKALGYVATAHDLDPRDGLVLLNLGRIQLELGHPTEGRAALEAVAGSDADDEMKAEAKRLLDDAKAPAAEPKP